MGRFLKHPRVLIETAILVTFDESGGFYDSGFIQPVDFFGDGPRVPLFERQKLWTRAPPAASGNLDPVTLAYLPPKNYPRGVIMLPATFDKPGKYAVLVTVRDAVP